MTLTLTAAGRSHIPTDQFELVNLWHREMGNCLQFAASLQAVHARIGKMQLWVSEHDEFDDKFAERSAQLRTENLAYLERATQMTTLADRVNVLQRKLTVESIEEIERQMHWPICDHLAMHLAIVARDTGISDFATVLDCFMRDNTTVNVNREAVPF